MTTDLDLEREAMDDVGRLRADDAYPGADLSGPLSVFDQTPAERPTRTNLEDLYSTYKIGDGLHTLRVFRLHPKMYASQNVAGFICDLHEQITLQQFHERFGGGGYEVQVRGGNPDKVDADHKHEIRTLTKVKFDLTGSPKMSEQAREFTRPSSGSDAVELKRMDYNEQRAREDRDRARKLEEDLARTRGGMTDSTMRMVDQMAEKRANDVRESFATQLNHQHAELDRLRDVLKRRESELEAANAKYTQYERDMTTKLFAEETRREATLKAQFTSDLERLRAEHAGKLEETRRDQERLLNEQRSRFEEERRHITEKAEDDRRRGREDMELREKRLSDDTRDRIATLITGYESRLAEMDRSCQREIGNAREQRDREVKNVEHSARSTTEVKGEAMKMRETLMANELQRLHTEVDSLKRENETMRMKLFKSPLEAVSEAQGLMEALGVGGAKEDPNDWKAGAVSVIKDAVKQLPDALKQFGEARQQNMAQRGGWVPPGQQPPQMMPPAQQQQMMQQQRRQAARPPVPQWERPAGVPPTPDERPGVPPPFDGPIAPPPMVRRAARPPAPPPPPQAPQQQQVQQPQPAPQAPQQQIEIPEEDAREFLDKLNEAIKSDIVKPSQFAEAFVQRVGADVARGLISSLTPQRLLEGIAQEPGGEHTAIATLEGQKFVEELWVETAKLVQV